MALTVIVVGRENLTGGNIRSKKIGMNINLNLYLSNKPTVMSFMK
jgi:hypothetical protein